MIVLVLVYAAAVFVAPRMKIWAIPYTYYSNAEDRVQIEEGEVYEQSFPMMANRICSFGIDMDTMESDNVAKIDCTLEIIDSNGVVIASKHITSAYDTSDSFSYMNVNRDEDYVIRLTVNDIPDDDSVVIPALKVNDLGLFAFGINGYRGSSDNKLVFNIMYLCVAALVIVFVLNSDKNKIGSARLEDRLIVGLLFLFAVFVISQQYDLFMTSKMAFRMKDSFLSGHFTDYVGDAYFRELDNQSSTMLFTYNYNFFFVFIVAILLIPFMPFYNGEITYSDDVYPIVLYLSVVIALLILVAVKLIQKISKECGMGDRYGENAKTIFITSSLLIYVSVAFGQLDILYVLVMLSALIFYYRKNYIVFSAIMSLAVAMKMLPLMVFVPLILLSNKRVKDLAINFVVVMIMPVISKLLFANNSGYNAVNAITNEKYSFMDRLVVMSIGDSIAIFVLLFAVISIAAYFHKADVDNKKEMLHKSMLLIFIVYGCFAAFVDWNQQWLIPISLSLAFLIPFYKDSGKLLMLSIASDALLILTANVRGSSVYMINFGVFQKLTGQSYGGASVKMILENLSPIAIPCITTASVAVIGFTIWLLCAGRPKEAYDTHECPRTLVIGRTGVLYGILLFYSWCFSFIG